MKRVWQRYRRDVSGTTSIEYAIMGALLAVAIGASFPLFSNAYKDYTIAIGDVLSSTMK